MAVIPYSTQWIEEDDIAAVAAVMRGTHLTQGPSVDKFEKALAAYLGVKHVVAVSSGTGALHLAVLGLIKSFPSWTTVRGFVPPITFAATLNCFWYTGSKATLVDVDPKTGHMTPETLEASLKATPRQMNEKRVVIAVSLQGRPLDYVGLKAVADRYDAVLVEDAAHAMGGSYMAEGKKYMMGGCGHTFASIGSFHAVKQLSMGEGGSVMTNDDTLAERIRLLRSHGIQRPGRKEDPSWYYEQVELGYHFRTNDMACALGFSQLGKLDERLAMRTRIAERYDAAFAQAPFKGKIWFVPHQMGHAYHLYVIHFSSSLIRDAAQSFLKEKYDIFSQIHYTPLYRFPYHQQKLGEMKLSGAEAYFKGCLSIPIFPRMSDEQQTGVIDALAEFVKTL